VYNVTLSFSRVYKKTMEICVITCAYPGGEIDMALNEYLGNAERIGLKLVLSFVRAFVAAFIVLVPGILAAPDFNAGKAAAIAALVGALAAAARAVQAGIASL
jgi:hypothetical protein